MLPRLQRGCLGLLIVGLVASCGEGRSADPPHERTPATPPEATTPPSHTTDTPAAPEPGPAPDGVTPAEVWDAEGIAVERLPDGSIRVRGQDRWGVRLDTVYADATYFANAVPVLSRSLTEAQARAMVGVVPRVRAAVAPAGAAP